MAKKRADVLLYEKGLVNSREKAKTVIMEGNVFIGTQRIDKPGEKIEETEEITVKENPLIYVSRGGLKLEKAMELFDISLDKKIAMDIGASTGGFTDCMLQNGAVKVYAIDVGYGQLDWKLRQDDRVVVMERTNIRYVTKDDIEDQIEFISIDVSFISLELVLPVAYELLKDKADLVCLVKPQFEAGREKVGKNGIVRDKKTHIEVLEEVTSMAQNIGFGNMNLSYSPITGAKGNREFILHLRKNEESELTKEDLLAVVDEAHDKLK